MNFDLLDLLFALLLGRGSLGLGGSGLLLCFRPDRLTLDGESRELLVGLSPSPFAENGEYKAIV